MRSARLRHVDLPEMGVPAAAPVFPPELYQDRLERCRARARRRGYDRLVVYADREHSANLAYLTGFDPRFEEALLVIGPDGEPALLVGNECRGMAAAAPLPLRVLLFQEFSLPGQPRDGSLPLGELLAGEGIAPGHRVGVLGWKEADDRSRIEIPAYVVDELRTITGPAGAVENANDILTGAADGLRVINEIEQLVWMEHAACHTSSAVRRVLDGLTPGMTEREAVTLLGWNGMPLSCHLMLTAGSRAALGLLSPGDRPIGRGDPFTIAYGVWGALNCRAGFVVEDGAELPGSISDYVDRLVAPYFLAIAEWYAALRVGRLGGDLHEIVDRRLGDPFFGIFLNPGHQIHLDEWVNSPVFPGSALRLESGMALQVDVIPATGGDYFTTNIEDGVALADAGMREQLADRFPEVFERITTRRAFMAEALGLALHPDVLPFSNIPAWLPPFLLDTGRAMTLT